MAEPPHHATALELGRAIAERTLSPVEVVTHYLDRIERWNERYGAYTTVTADLALELAARAEAALADGQVPTGPLFGVPIPVKDLTNLAGVATGYGSAAYRDQVPDVDDHVVTAVLAAGMIPLGKSSTPEFGLPCYTEPVGLPPARSPWDTRRGAGGSSGGAAAAVAAGLAPLAHGSDGGGSIRIPASVCGLVGLKPTRDRISSAPRGGDPAGLGCHGPLARTVRDAAALLDVLAGPVLGDAHLTPVAEPFLPAVDRDPGRLRIGRHLTPIVADTEVHPEAVRAWEQTSQLLADLGHQVEDCPPVGDRATVPLFETVWAVGAASVPVEAAHEELLTPLTRWLRRRGQAVSAVEYAQALGGIQQAARCWLTGSAGYDLVLTPTLSQPPALVGELRDDADPAADFENQKRFTPWTSVYNVTGQPAVSLPLHWWETDETDGATLPIGVMLAARAGEEALLLSAAGQLEAARPWAHRWPAGC